MPANERLLRLVRAEFSALAKVAEKQMFGGVAFMLDGKMCVSVGKDRIMCRIGADAHDAAVAREGCKATVMRGRKLRGYVHVSESVLQSPAAVRSWTSLAIAFNPKT